MASRVLHDLNRINEGLAADIDALVPRLFLSAVQVGNFWELGSIHGEPGQSLKIWRTGSKQGEWADFSAGKGGRPLELVIQSQFAGNGNVRQGIEWAVRFLNMGVSETPEERAAREAEDQRQREKRAREREADNERKRKSALGLFLSAAPIGGTLAEKYLLGRAIDLRLLGRQPGALRFKPELKCPETGIMRPGLLACVSNEHGFLTVHRHFLQEREDGTVGKADMRSPKQSYSANSGGVISIWRGDSGKPLRDMPEGEWIAASEGIEDALSMALAQPDMRVVASVSLGNLGKMFLPRQCGGIYWHRHRGDPPQAIADYEKQLDQLDQRGIAVREVWAPDEAKDFNEWLQREAKKAASH
jgi:hypothetical protein